MEPLYHSFTALAVTGIYIVWRAYDEMRRQRQGRLHQRVAYLLWVAASRVD